MKKGRRMHVAAHPNGLHGREQTAKSAAVFDLEKRGLQHFLLPFPDFQINYSNKPNWRSMHHFELRRPGLIARPAVPQQAARDILSA
ncbi:hypothetical protein [Herbaspirillum sp. BH-1]|uniref:hypothetical protein n=1 Tax=Herbaspirillum sp. (strain BH-1) TaxID=2058884 RepID=UPI0011AED2A7|nr:hypothetical protein [Herbaspirillum sp. BH-1]